MKRDTPHHKPYRILVLVHTDWDYGREIVQAVRHYAFTTGRMEVGNVKLQEGIELRQMVVRQKVDGIIAVVRSRAVEAEMMQLGIPVVNISNVLNPTLLPLVTQEDCEAGKLAATHLLSLGCTTLAYWGQKDARFSQQRIEGFLEEIKRRDPSVRCIGGGGRSLAQDEGEPLLSQMRPWLKKLPPKTGVFAVLDPFALHLLQVAREIGKHVPEDIAVMGAGDDCFWVNFENIPLTSVRLPFWKIGVAAATLLDELITARAAPAKRRREPSAEGFSGNQPPVRYLPVTEVAVRQSTDVLFADDGALSKAITYIRTNAAKSIYVPDVVRASGISRSGLQRRFAQFLKRSILEEIQNARVERIKTLLRSSDMKITEIAEACDFPNTPRMHVLFRQCTGQTPSQYRKEFQKR